MENSLRKLTEKERQRVTFVMNDFFEKYFPDEPSDPEYITEYDVLMKEKDEAFKMSFLKDNEPSEIASLMEICDNYIKDETDTSKMLSTAFGLIIMYDMWLNESPVWPVMNNPKWDEWEKLKKKKVRRRDS